MAKCSIGGKQSIRRPESFGFSSGDTGGGIRALFSLADAQAIQAMDGTSRTATYLSASITGTLTFGGYEYIDYFDYVNVSVTISVSGGGGDPMTVGECTTIGKPTQFDYNMSAQSTVAGAFSAGDFAKLKGYVGSEQTATYKGFAITGEFGLSGMTIDSKTGHYIVSCTLIVKGNAKHPVNICGCTSIKDCSTFNVNLDTLLVSAGGVFTQADAKTIIGKSGSAMSAAVGGMSYAGQGYVGGTSYDGETNGLGVEVTMLCPTAGTGANGVTLCGVKSIGKPSVFTVQKDNRIEVIALDDGETYVDDKGEAKGGEIVTFTAMFADEDVKAIGGVTNIEYSGQSYSDRKVAVTGVSSSNGASSVSVMAYVNPKE